MGRRKVEEEKGCTGLDGGGELDLDGLGGFLEALVGEGLRLEVDALLLLELLTISQLLNLIYYCNLNKRVHHVVEEDVVEVLATEEGVTVGGLDLKDAVSDLEDRDIECSTTKIVHSDDLST